MPCLDRLSSWKTVEVGLVALVPNGIRWEKMVLFIFHQYCLVNRHDVSQRRICKAVTRPVRIFSPKRSHQRSEYDKTHYVRDLEQGSSMSGRCHRSSSMLRSNAWRNIRRRDSSTGVFIVDEFVPASFASEAKRRVGFGWMEASRALGVGTTRSPGIRHGRQRTLRGPHVSSDRFLVSTLTVADRCRSAWTRHCCVCCRAR